MLADPKRQAEHDAAESALVQMGSDAAGPMLAILAGAGGVLANDGGETKVRAIRVLAAMRVPETADLFSRLTRRLAASRAVRAAAEAALKRLLGHVPSREEALQTLLSQTLAYLHGRQAIRGELDGWATLWSWDAAKNTWRMAATGRIRCPQPRGPAGGRRRWGFAGEPPGKNRLVDRHFRGGRTSMGGQGAKRVPRSCQLAGRPVSAPRSWATC